MTEPDPNQPPTPDGAQPTPEPDQPPAPTGQPPVAPGPAPSGQPPVTPEPAPGVGYPQGGSGPAGPYGAPASAPTDPYGGSAPGPVYPPAASAPGPAPAYPTAASAPGPAAGPAPVYPTGGEYPPAAPAYVPPAPQGSGPGRGLAITALVLGVIPCTALIGVVLSIVALVKGRGSADSSSRVMAIIGLVIGALWTVAAIWFGVVFVDIYQTCDELGNGVHYVDGVRYDCSF